MKSKRKIIILSVIYFALILIGVICGKIAFDNLADSHVNTEEIAESGASQGESIQTVNSKPDEAASSQSGVANSESKNDVSTNDDSKNEVSNSEPVHNDFMMPDYEGVEVVQVCNNVPDFANEQGTDEYVKFSELDLLGRAGVAIGCIGPSILATEERESIGMVKPSGWHTVKYEFIDGLYLYNRCHLIAYELCGVNADERNLITGTRYLNIMGMLDLENEVAWYVRDTGNHVYYRATPRYEGDNLLATGVQIEAKSVEDNGIAISMNVFCFNVQPGVLIDLATGDNELDEDYEPVPERGIVPNFEDGIGQEQEGSTADQDSTSDVYVPSEGVTYVLNINTMRFHLPGCESVQDTKAKNRKEFFGTREELIAAGYKPCGRCHP